MGDLVINFRTQLSELQDHPYDRLTSTIEADFGFFDEDRPDDFEPVGSVQAHLFNIYKMIDSRLWLFDFYDCQSRHLADSIELIYDSEIDDFREKIITKVGFEIGPMIQWHLNITRMDVAPAARGQRCGLRVMALLRSFTERQGLIVTAKAHPEAIDAPRAPHLPEVRRLRAYYASDRSWASNPLGGKAGLWQTGRPDHQSHARRGWSGRRRSSHLSVAVATGRPNTLRWATGWSGQRRLSISVVLQLWITVSLV